MRRKEGRKEQGFAFVEEKQEEEEGKKERKRAQLAHSLTHSLTHSLSPVSLAGKRTEGEEGLSLSLSLSLPSFSGRADVLSNVRTIRPNL